jgi:LCP family protein required for cell wall assembly
VPDAKRHPLARTLVRLLGGSLLIAILATVASATVFFEDVGIISDAIGHGVLIKSAALAPTYAGQPVTIMILGSDSRAESHIAVDRLDPRHSDTIILAHLDPQSGQTTLMSIPRDLQVSFYARGNYYPDVKINSAITYGGPAKTVQVVEHILPGIKINDLIVIDFESFAFLVDGLGCVYIDVDHLYSNPAGDGFAQIYIPPGYRPLCGYQALSYARYRHDDSTYARDAREQDFIRQAKQQLSIRTNLLTDPSDLQHLLTKVSSNGGIETNIHGSEAVLRLVEIAEASVAKPVRQLQFPDDGSVTGPNGDNQVMPSQSQIHGLVGDFLYGRNQVYLPPKSSAPSRGHHHHHHGHTVSAASLGLVTTPSYAIGDAQKLQVAVPFPVEIPRVTSPAGFFPAQDAFYHFKYKVPWVATYGGKVYHAYRITWEDASVLGAYYGIDGMDWTNPPLFANAKTDVIGGRKYMFVTNGSAYQDIGWIQGKDLYWVSNTIFDNISRAAMLRIAESAAPVS